jgi:hypothetical protein
VFFLKHQKGPLKAFKGGFIKFIFSTQKIPVGRIKARIFLIDLR